MIRPNDLSRVVKTARYEIHKNGLRGLLTAIQRRFYLEMRLFPYRNVNSVMLNGCKFDVAHALHASMKVALLDHSYEAPERRSVLQHLRPDLPVVELGGCIGVVACITNKLLKDQSAHVVVEASPMALPYLTGNRNRNGCRFEILNAAIAYGNQDVTFVSSTDFCGNSLERKGGGERVTVKTLSLGDIVSERNFDSFTLICDIEGYEYDMVQREPYVLAKADTIILETHARMIGERPTTELLSKLREIGFRTVSQDSYVYVMRRLSD